MARLLRSLAAPLALVLTPLAGIGLVAIGISGVVAAAFGAMFGKAYVAGDMPGVAYTPTRCGELHALHPEAATCAAAAVAHHFDEIVDYRLAAGVAGLALLLGVVWARRRLRPPAGLLPDGFAATVGAALFGVAAAGLLAQGLGETIAWGRSGGGGGLISGGLISAAVFLSYAIMLLRLLSRRLDAMPR